MKIDAINGKTESVVKAVKNNGENRAVGKSNVTTSGKTLTGLQDDPDSKGRDTKKDVVIPDVMPKFNDGDPAVEFSKYVARTLHYPELAVEQGITGKVVVQFTVQQIGNLNVTTM